MLRWKLFSELAEQPALPEELAFFGPASRPDYRRLQEAIWQVVTRQDCPGVRLYAGGSRHGMLVRLPFAYSPTDWLDRV